MSSYEKSAKKDDDAEFFKKNENAGEAGWRDAVTNTPNRNPHPAGSGEHDAYENGYQNGLEAMP